MNALCLGHAPIDGVHCDAKKSAPKGTLSSIPVQFAALDYSVSHSAALMPGSTPSTTATASRPLTRIGSSGSQTAKCSATNAAAISFAAEALSSLSKTLNPATVPIPSFMEK